LTPRQKPSIICSIRRKSAVYIDQYGQVSVSASEFFTSLYQGKHVIDIAQVCLDDVQAIEQFNTAKLINGDRFTELSNLPDLDGITVEQFDRDNQSNWFMPETYQTMDIAKWLVEQCTKQDQLDRIDLELKYFLEYNMMDLLRYLKYLVDTMRDHNILWGVGRGSSTASYCLYLIGIHKIDCLNYQIPIEEFFKNQGEENGL